MLVLLVFAVNTCMGFNDVVDLIENLNLRKAPPKLNLDQTFFPSLENYHVSGKTTTDKIYPWIAQVIHSRSNNYPFICTSVCVDPGVFMTAARCIISLKVVHTSILYKSKRLPVRAFVVPSKPTSQQFDDIGFIVIHKGDVTYSSADLYPAKNVKRTDMAFKWFDKINHTGPFKVVGYATEKGIHKVKLPEILYNLKELPILINMKTCTNIFTNNQAINSFSVPCYFSCTLPEFRKKDAKCDNYLGVEGAAVYNTKTKKILGIATWGAYYHDYELPVGFSVVNSEVFQEDFRCAKKIRKASVKLESYHHLC